MKTIRPAFALVPLWAAAIIIAWVILGPSEAPRVDEWKTARALPVNAQVRDDALVGPKERYRLARMAGKDALVGRHLRVGKKVGDSIRLEDTAWQPEFDVCEPRSGVLLYSLKNEEYLADAVDIGSWVTLCYSRTGTSATAAASTICAKHSVAVESVHRATSQFDSTWIALRIPSCLIQDVGEFLSRDKRFLLVAANPPPPAQRACRR